MNIITVKCRRCGKLLAATAQSLYGLDTLKRQWGYLCEFCATPDEKYQIVEEIGKGIIQAEEKGK